MSLLENAVEAEKVYSKMKERYPDTEWSPEIFMMDLIEEIGELSNALLCTLGHKFPHRQKSDLGDAFFDVLFDLFLLANRVGVDVEKEWKKGISNLLQRLDNGEFDPQVAPGDKS